MKTNGSQWSYRSLAAMGLPVALAGATLFMAGCASAPPPTEQMATSSAAVTHAAEAGGAELASAEMQSARDKLDRAKLAMVSEDFNKARSLALEAQADAQLAEAKAGSAKARKSADQLKDDVQVLTEELDRKAK